MGDVARPQGPAHSLLSGDAAVGGSIEATDGISLHYLRWSSTPTEPWAVVIFLHGIASHAGWFGETAKELEGHGVAVYAADRRGSGRSGGPRGHLPSYERALDDIGRLVALVASEQPGRPLFLAGSSWAAKLALVYAAVRPGPLSGLLLLGPGLLPRVSLTLPRRVTALVGHVVAPRLRIAIPLTPEMYTGNRPYLEFIRTDQRRLLTATAQFFWQTARLDRRRSRAAAMLRVPLLLVQGTDDVMVDVPATHRWFAALPVADKTYEAYRGAGHTLDFEPDEVHGRYVADLLHWLSTHAAPRTGASEGGL
jgi:acylglycerol lipase